MNQSIRIEIAESTEELKRLYKQQPIPDSTDDVLYLLKIGKLLP